MNKIREALNVQNKAIALFRDELNKIEKEPADATKTLEKIDALYNTAMAELDRMESEKPWFTNEQFNASLRLAENVETDDDKRLFLRDPIVNNLTTLFEQFAERYYQSRMANEAHEKLISEWADSEGFQGFYVDHAAVLRNLAKWLDIRRNNKEFEKCKQH